MQIADVQSFRPRFCLSGAAEHFALQCMQDTASLSLLMFILIIAPLADCLNVNVLIVANGNWSACNHINLLSHNSFL